MITDFVAKFLSKDRLAEFAAEFFSAKYPPEKKFRYSSQAPKIKTAVKLTAVFHRMKTSPLVVS